MHTLQKDNFTLHFCSDLSGNMLITQTMKESPHLVLNQIEVPCSILLECVANAVRMRRISELEDMTTEEILSGRS